MNVPSILRSFAVIAVAALVASLLFGLLLGSVTGMRVRPLSIEGGGVIKPPRAPANNISREIPAIREHTNDGEEGPLIHKDGPIKPEQPKHVTVSVDYVPPPVRPAELKDGPVDPLPSTDLSVEIKGMIVVQVRNANDRPVTHAMLRLEVDGGPLGWLPVPKSVPERTENPGEWRYDGLMAGKYRVTSLTTNTAIVSQNVNIEANTLAVTVVLRLETVRQVQVEFAVTLPDGTLPTEVNLRAVQQAVDATNVKGRFGDHYMGIRGIQSYGVSNPARIPVPTSGVLTQTMNSTGNTDFQFMTEKDGKRFQKTVTVVGQTTLQRVDVRLAEVDPESDDWGTPASAAMVSLDLTFVRSDGKPLTVDSSKLCHKPDDALWFTATGLSGSTATWASVQAGRWYVVMEALELDAPYIVPVSFTGNTAKNITVDVGQLTLRMGRDPGSATRGDGKLAFKVRIRPKGSETQEKTFAQEFATDQKAVSSVYNLPAGSYTILGEFEGSGLGLEPASRKVTITGGANTTIDFALRAACTLKFVAIDGQGGAIAGIEFLVSFNPAGALTDEEKSAVKLGSPDGRCMMEGAPYGAVYLHVWTSSTDLQHPDKVFKIDLPAYGEKDLGALVLNR